MSNLTISNDNNSATQPSLNSNLFQIDVLKVIAIFFVIMDHTFTHDFLDTLFSSFWERTAIPIFMIIMGFNLGISFHRKYNDQANLVLKDLYTKEYFESRIKRYILPYLLVYLIHTITYIVIQTRNISVIQNNPFYESINHVLIGYTPFWGPGMWFIPVICSSILIFPLFYYFFRQDPKTLLLGSIIVEVSINFFTQILYTSGSPQTFVFFYSNILFMASAIGLGLWLINGYGYDEPRNKWFRPLFILSIIYILIFSLYKVEVIGMNNPLIILIAFLRGDYNFMFFGYSAFFVLLALNYIPENPDGFIPKTIRTISKSTYHILMTQILYFSYIYHFVFDIETGYESSPINYLWFFPVNLIITFCIGVIWYTLEQKFYKNIADKTIRKFIYKVGLSLGAAFLVIRILSQFVFLFLFFP